MLVNKISCKMNHTFPVADCVIGFRRGFTSKPPFEAVHPPRRLFKIPVRESFRLCSFEASSSVVKILLQVSKTGHVGSWPASLIQSE